MQYWEYKTLSFTVEKGVLGARECNSQAFDNELNQWGEQGWELVAVVGITTTGSMFQIVATLKRERK